MGLASCRTTQPRQQRGFLRAFPILNPPLLHQCLRSLVHAMTHSSVAALEDRADGARSALRTALSRLSSLAAGLAVQFRVSVSHPMYHNVRLMFIEKMGLAYDFDFHRLVTSGRCWQGLEEQPTHHAG